MRVKKGDKVKIIAGANKGKEGIIKQSFPAENKVIVDGDKIKKFKKHNKPNQQNQEGSITEVDAKIDASNVMLIDPKTKKPTRVGYAVVDGKKVRIAKKSGVKID